MKKKLLNIIGENQAENGISRRDFLKVLGSGVAATAVVGCADSAKQNILPMVKGDGVSVPGEALWFKSACTQCAAGCGVMLRTREGRVVKVEGNPDHPINQGGLCALGHSALQGHYDPDRVREPLMKDKETKTFKPVSWEAAFAKIAAALNKEGKKSFITDAYTGSITKLLATFSKNYEVNHVPFNILEQSALAQAANMVYGVNGIPSFDFEAAEVILNFGADYMETWISPVEFSRAWSKSRKSSHPARFIQIEPRLSLTGANADTWLNCKPGTESLLLMAVIKELLARGLKGTASYETLNNLHELTANINLETVAAKSGVAREKIISAANYLAQAKHSLVLAGGTAASNSNALALQSLAAFANLLLGNVGSTVKFDKLRPATSDLTALKALIAEIEKGEHSLMFVDASNPVFTLPGSYKLSLALQKLDLLVAISSNIDETAKQADIILPLSSSLESWGDAQPYAGVNNLIQPAMNPIFNSKGLGDILLGIDSAAKKTLADYPDYLSFLKGSWKEIQRAQASAEAFDSFWDKSVEQGGSFGKTRAVAASSVNPKVFDLDFVAGSFSHKKLATDSELVLLPFASVRSFDGRAANRPWMQEIPDPITQIAWDSWAEIHPQTAKKLNLKTGDLVKVFNYYGEVTVPAFITEYVNPGVIAVPIGNGHDQLGRYARAVKGGNVIDLIADDSGADFNGLAFLSVNVGLRRARGNNKLVIIQGSDSQLGRELAQTKYLGHGEEHHSGHHGAEHDRAKSEMYEQRIHPLYRWGMAVDLAACNGCTACVAACYSENNIPTVGKRTMDNGREMSWLRIERYHDGSAEELQVSFLPMMCQHCNNAPCEPVCPVYATYHTEEGLNAMIYNRCVGTRYCSNNCAYKVRRFNWYEFDFPSPLDLQLNPDVMKRTAGVMEKCTFCVQRISEGKDKAKDAGRLVADGEIKPACVQSCPTQALVFGDLNDPNSRVSRLAKNERAYKVLDHHLNTQPSVSYLQDVKYKA